MKLRCGDVFCMWNAIGKYQAFRNPRSRGNDTQIKNSIVLPFGTYAMNNIMEESLCKSMKGCKSAGAWDIVFQAWQGLLLVAGAIFGSQL